VKQETKRIPLAGPLIDERDEELVLEVLRSGWLSLGPMGPRFEEAFADFVGARHAAAVSSGTAGLHLCMRLAGVRPGDEVITSPYSFAASANCAMYEGATPVFADIDPRTLNLDPAAVEAAVTEHTRAIVAVDIFGYPCELDPLLAVCERHGLSLVQDACEALGAEYKGRRLGSHGHPTVFARVESSRRPRRRSTHCSFRFATKAAATPAAGFTTSASGSTIASTTCRRHSGSGRSRSSTGSWPLVRRSRLGTTRCSAGSRSRLPSPTTTTTGARGSCTSSSCRPSSTATA
jgi:hypothetical protein